MPVGARVLHLCEARGALRPLSGASARLLCCLRTQVWTKWMRGDPAHRERPPPLHSLFARALSSIATSSSTLRRLLSASHSGSDPSLAPEGLRLHCPLEGPSFIRNQVRLFRDTGYCTVLLSRAQTARV